MDFETVTAEHLGIPTAIPLPKRKDWRLGFVGFGRFAGRHVNAYSLMNWRVTAAAAPSAASRERAKKAGIGRVYADFQDLVSDDEVDVIVILTQPTIREGILNAAAKAGKPVLTEKPLALDMGECQRMVATAEQARIPFAVSENYRWAGANFFAHHLIRKGLIGKPFLASIEIYGTQDVDLRDRPFYIQCTDFLTVQWNTHLADLLRYLTGQEARRVFAVTRRMEGQNFVSDNLFTAIVDFGQGLLGYILHTELVRSSMTGRHCRVDGDQGTIMFDLNSDRLSIDSRQLGGGEKVLDLAPLRLPPSQCGSMGDLLISIEEQREPLVSARRYLPVMRQVLSEQASAQAGGQWVALE